jgi:hypothetical protein
MLHLRCSIAIRFSTNTGTIPFNMNKLNESGRLARGLLALAAAASCLIASPVLAAEVAGVKMDDVATLSGQPLVLNGLGLRSKMFIKVYVVGLYLPHKETLASEVLDMPGAKRVQLVMMRDVGAELLADNLSKGLADGTAKAELAQLQPRVETLKAVMRSVGEAHKGSRIQLDYLPGAGTRVSVDGKTIGGDIPGEDFYRALLRIWIGDEVGSKPLKAELLGLPRT